MDISSEDWRRQKEAAKKLGIDTSGFDEGFSSRLYKFIGALQAHDKAEKALSEEADKVAKIATSYKTLCIELEDKYRGDKTKQEAVRKMGRWCERLEQWCLMCLK